MEAAREDRARWPQDQMWRYQTWIESLVVPPHDINHSLAHSEQLEAELAHVGVEVG